VCATNLPIVAHAKFKNLDTIVSVHKFLEGNTHYMQEENESLVKAMDIKFLG